MYGTVDLKFVITFYTLHGAVYCTVYVNECQVLILRSELIVTLMIHSSEL